jgi:hypothetical protein
MYAQGDLLTINLNRMSKRCELQKEYYQANGNYKGNGKYCDKYVSWLEDQILALRMHDVSGILKCCSCGYEYEELIIAKDGNMKCKDCAF